MLKRNLAAARRIAALLALGLMVAVVGAGPVAPAQAAPSSAGEIRYFMEARKARGAALICLGDTVTINVKIVRAQGSPGNGLNAENVAGIKVTSAVADASIGTLDRATTYTGWRGDRLGFTTFKFLAQKAGSTTISFEGHIRYSKGILEYLGVTQHDVQADLVSDSVNVTVEECEYQVTVVSTWRESNRKDVATISQARLAKDAPGHYTGSSPVDWFILQTRTPQGCDFHTVDASSQANLTAQLDPITQKLQVEITYKPLPVVWYTYRSDDCTRGSEIDYTAMAGKLNFAVPVGAVTGSGPQTLTAPGSGIFNGTADVTVARVPK